MIFSPNKMGLEAGTAPRTYTGRDALDNWDAYSRA